MQQQVILVNEADEPIGAMEKIEAHEKALLHRAFSVFIFNQKGEMLLQQRAIEKYHSGGLWTNACCSHPIPGEETLTAANRRLGEELGFNTPLQPMFNFTYKAVFDNGLTEYEFDHVFYGVYDGPLKINQNEVMDVSFKSTAEIKNDLWKKPSGFTAWFRLAFPRVEQWISAHQANLVNL